MKSLSHYLDLVRKIAKSSHYQTLYHNCKETGLKLFKNDIELSNVQLYFLQYLGFYSSLNLEVYMGEVSDIVFKDFLYEDAYMYYREKNKNKDKKEEDNNSSVTKGNRTQEINKTTYLFKAPPKK